MPEYSPHEIEALRLKRDVDEIIRRDQEAYRDRKEQAALPPPMLGPDGQPKITRWTRKNAFIKRTVKRSKPPYKPKPQTKPGTSSEPTPQPPLSGELPPECPLCLKRKPYCHCAET